MLPQSLYLIFSFNQYVWTGDLMSGFAFTVLILLTSNSWLSDADELSLWDSHRMHASLAGQLLAIIFVYLLQKGPLIAKRTRPSGTALLSWLVWGVLHGSAELFRVVFPPSQSIWGSIGTSWTQVMVQVVICRVLMADDAVFAGYATPDRFLRCWRDMVVALELVSLFDQNTASASVIVASCMSGGFVLAAIAYANFMKLEKKD
jgi:hypothetical protein